MVIPVPLAGRPDLEVMVLDMVTNLRRPNQPDLSLPRYYAYWFVGKDRETPHHGQRMLYMGLDRVLRSVAHRWAYISVSGMRDPARPDAHFDEIREVLALIYPAMVRPDA